MRSRSFVVLAAVAGLVVAATQLRSQAPDSTHHPRGGVRVAVADAGAGTSLWGADVELPMLDVSFSVPDNGKLLIDHVPEGTYVIRVHRIGYGVQTKIITVKSDTPSVRFALDRAPTELETVNVVAKENSGMRDFEARLRAANGKFFTASDIEKTGARLLTQFLETVHGVRLQPTGGGYSEMSPMGAAGVCPSGVLVYLDGVAVNALEGSDPSRQFRGATALAVPRNTTSSGTSAANSSGSVPTGARAGAAAIASASGNQTANPIRESAALPPFDINQIPLSQIGAMEVYPDGGPKQMRYGAGSPCGVVLLFSKAKG